MKKYLKKFSIMFVMLLSIVSVGIIQNGTMANAAENGLKRSDNTDHSTYKNVGTTLWQPEDGWKRVEDTDSNILYSNEFRTIGSNAFSDSSGRSSSLAGQSIKFNFTGTKLRIIGFNYQHIATITITIDGQSVGNISSPFMIKGPQAIYDNQDLTSGEHYVTISTADTNEFQFDAVDIDKNGQLKQYTEYIPSISLNKVADNLQVGESDTLVAATLPVNLPVSWIPSDPSIASVDSMVRLQH